jgi:hypothetical protein
MPSEGREYTLKRIGRYQHFNFSKSSLSKFSNGARHLRRLKLVTYYVAAGGVFGIKNHFYVNVVLYQQGA